MTPDLQLILVGLAVGMLVAAPVGPVNVMCIQRTLERGMWGGLAAGLGAVIGDGLIAFVAALGRAQHSPHRSRRDFTQTAMRPASLGFERSHRQCVILETEPQLNEHQAGPFRPD